MQDFNQHAQRKFFLNQSYDELLFIKKLHYDIMIMICVILLLDFICRCRCQSK